MEAREDYLKPLMECMGPYWEKKENKEIYEDVEIWIGRDNYMGERKKNGYKNKTMHQKVGLMGHPIMDLSGSSECTRYPIYV